MSKLDLNLLVAFDAMMQERNLRVAGERLGRTQPAMSATLSRLRVHFGDRLFVRSPTGIVPTARAETIWDELRDPLNAIRSVMVPETFDPKAYTGEYAIGLSDDFELLIFPSLVETVHRFAPSVRLRAVEVDHRSAAMAVLDGSVDVALSVVTPDRQRGVARLDLFKMPFVILHQPTIAAPKTPAAYARHKHVGIAFAERDEGFVTKARRESGAGELIASTPRFCAIPRLIEATGGIATLPRPIALHLASASRLAVSPCPIALPAVDVALLWHERRRHHPANVWLREMVRNSSLVARDKSKRANR